MTYKFGVKITNLLEQCPLYSLIEMHMNLDDDAEYKYAIFFWNWVLISEYHLILYDIKDNIISNQRKIKTNIAFAMIPSISA